MVTRSRIPVVGAVGLLGSLAGMLVVLACIINLQSPPNIIWAIWNVGAGGLPI
jgi:hypothetical protein